MIITNYCLLGQPQMIKLVQSSGKSVSGIVTTIPGQQIKLFKSPISGQECTQVSALFKLIYMFFCTNIYSNGIVKSSFLSLEPL